MMAATWLSQDVLLLIAPAAGRSDGAAVLDTGGQTRIVTTHHFNLAGTDQAILIIAPALEQSIREGAALRLAAGESPITLDAAALDRQLTDLQTIGREHLAGLGASQREAAQRFFVTNLLGGDQAGGIDGLPLKLAALREMLRERRLGCPLGGLAAQAVHLDVLHAVDDRSFWIRGWLYDGLSDATGLVAISPEGETVELLPQMFRFARPEIAKLVGAGADDPRLAKAGFAGLVELTTRSVVEKGWLVELHSAAADPVETAAPDVMRGEFGDSALAAVTDTQLKEFRARIEYPVRLKLRRRQANKIKIETVTDFGAPPATPAATLVIPLLTNENFIEQQLALFSADPLLWTVDLIYVVANPAHAATAMARAERLAQVYPIPFRIAVLNQKGTRADAVNAAAGIGRCRWLVLLGAKVFPARSGWLDKWLVAAATGTPGGALGANLLGENGIRTPTDQRAVTITETPSVSADGLLIDREKFLAAGGLSTLYLTHQFEEADLCRRLSSAGGINRLTSAAELYCLPELTAEGTPEAGASAFDEWLFKRTWKEAFQQGVSLAATVEIDSVNRLPLNDGLFLGGILECPKPGDKSDLYAINLSGWVLGREQAVTAIEVNTEYRCLWRAAVQSKRADIAGKFPQSSQAAQCGFNVAVGAVLLPREFELQVVAVLADESKTPLATIRGRRRSWASSFTPKLQPLLLSTLGRSGSTWAVRVLGEHPQIMEYRSFEYEPRLVSYWLEVLKSITEPGSYRQALRGDIDGDDWWLGTRCLRAAPIRDLDPEIHQWIGGRHVETVAAFCLERIDAFYHEAARLLRKPNPVYFVEKCWPGNLVTKMITELYPGGREVFLVRDFRDVVCSILAFNQKRGFVSFGRQAVQSDREFIKQWRDTAQLTLANWRQRSGRAHLLRYEDLILKPEPTLHAVFDYLGLDASDKVIQETLERAHAVPAKMQDKHRTSKDPAASVGRWRQDLSPELQAECTLAFGDVLQQFGYE